MVEACKKKNRCLTCWHNYSLLLEQLRPVTEQQLIYNLLPKDLQLTQDTLLGPSRAASRLRLQQPPSFNDNRINGVVSVFSQTPSINFCHSPHSWSFRYICQAIQVPLSFKKVKSSMAGYLGLQHPS